MIDELEYYREENEAIYSLEEKNDIQISFEKFITR